MSILNPKVILITGATGHIGSELVTQLQDSGHTIRALIREVSQASLPHGVEAVMGDLSKPETLLEALKGVGRVFLMDPSHGQAFTSNLVMAAKANNVERIVDLSTIGAGLDPMPVMGKWHYEREQTIKNSGMDWTILRPNSFMSNSYAWINSIRSEGIVSNSIGPGKISIIDPADIASVAAVALTQDGHTGTIYTLTGPEALTSKKQVAILSRTLGRTLEYKEITQSEANSAMKNAGRDAETVAAVGEVNSLLRNGRGAVITEDVERVTGSKPATFENWCHRNAKYF